MKVTIDVNVITETEPSFKTIFYRQAEAISAILRSAQSTAEENNHKRVDSAHTIEDSCEAHGFIEEALSKGTDR